MPMNRRPTQSRTGYDSFSPRHAAHFTASTPARDFFDPRKKRPLPLRLAFFILSSLFAVLVINFAVNCFVHVKTLSVPVRNLASDFDGYTILHISDLKGASFGGNQQVFAPQRKKQPVEFIKLKETWKMIEGGNIHFRLYSPTLSNRAFISSINADFSKNLI